MNLCELRPAEGSRGKNWSCLLYTSSRRHMTVSAFDEITKSTPEKSLVVHLRKTSGRNNQGKLTVRHHGGGAKIKYRRCV